MNYTEKTVSSNDIYKGKIIEVRKLTVELPDGKEATRDIVLHPGASVIIPISSDGYIYMVRQYRKPIEKISLELPAGKLDPGEEPSHCALRELKEETGLKAGKIEHVIDIYSTPGFSNEVLHIYAATELEQSEACADEDEFISCEKHHIKTLLDMISSNKINDAKTVIGILLAEKLIKKA